MRFEVIRQNLLKLEADKCSSSDIASYAKKKASEGNNVGKWLSTDDLLGLTSHTQNFCLA